MKISPPIEVIATELEDWAQEDGWKTVGLAIADQYQVSGGGEILPATDTSRGLINATQRVKRIFRGFDGPRYAQLAAKLKAAALDALPPERRLRLESPGDPILLAAVAAREGIEAINAVHLRAPVDVICREVNQAIAAFQSVRAAVMAWEGGRYGTVHV